MVVSLLGPHKIVFRVRIFLPTLISFLIYLESSKLPPCPQGSRLKPEKTATAAKEPASRILPLHTGDIDTPPRPTKKVVKPVSVAVGWSDLRTLQGDFLDAYPAICF